MKAKLRGGSNPQPKQRSTVVQIRTRVAAGRPMNIPHVANPSTRRASNFSPAPADACAVVHPPSTPPSAFADPAIPAVGLTRSSAGLAPTATHAHSKTTGPAAACTRHAHSIPGIPQPCTPPPLSATPAHHPSQLPARSKAPARQHMPAQRTASLCPTTANHAADTVRQGSGAQS